MTMVFFAEMAFVGDGSGNYKNNSVSNGNGCEFSFYYLAQ
jgi:hypothetical protein